VRVAEVTPKRGSAGRREFRENVHIDMGGMTTEKRRNERNLTETMSRGRPGDFLTHKAWP